MSNGRVWLGLPGSEQLLSNVERRFSEEDIEFSKKNRTASGRYVKDVITTKKKFVLSYSRVNNDTLETLKNIYTLNLKQSLNLKVEQNNGFIAEYTVSIKPFSRSRLLSASEWLWEGISIEIEEV